MMTVSRQEVGDIAFAVSTLILSGLIGIKARDFRPMRAGGAVGADPGPGLFPRLVAFVLAGLSIAIIVVASRNLIKRHGSSHTCQSHEAMPEYRRRYAVPALLFILLVLYAWIMPLIGFGISTIAFLFVCMMVLGRKEWKRRKIIVMTFLAISLLATFGIYGLFHYVAKVPLPMGRLLTGG